MHYSKSLMHTVEVVRVHMMILDVIQHSAWMAYVA